MDDALRFLGEDMPRTRAEALASVLGEAGWPLVVAVSAFEHDAEADAGWRVEVFCTPRETGVIGASQAADGEADIARRLAAWLQELAVLAGQGEVVFRHEPLPRVDWVAKVQQGLAPVRAGRFFVHGAHDRARRRPHLVNIEIEAGQAFGTGHHGTTRGCLLALDWLLQRRLLRASGRRGARVLDVGTGSGVLGIAAARALRASVLATDIDAVAVATARENARLNGVPGMRLAVAAGTRHALVRRSGGGAWPVRQVSSTQPGVARVRRALAAARVPLPMHARWRVLRPAARRRGRRWGHDLVFANILAGPLVRMAAELSAVVRPGGWLVLSGLLREQERMVLAAFRQHDMVPCRRWPLGEWSTLLLRRGRRCRV